jgi:hypothetical protein
MPVSHCSKDSQMHRLIAATALCAVALGATAGAAATPQVSAHARPAGLAMQTAATPAMRAERVRTGGTATVAASTNSSHAEAGQGEGDPAQTGPATLLAAVALMLGVALRRMGAGPR